MQGPERAGLNTCVEAANHLAQAPAGLLRRLLAKVATSGVTCSRMEQITDAGLLDDDDDDDATTAGRLARAGY